MENQPKQPEWANPKPKSKLKWWHIVLFLLAIFIAISIISRPTPVNDDPVINTTAATKPTANEWVEVYSFKGNGRKKSESFHLTGNDAKIMYEYKSDSPDIGVLYIYVVDKGDDIMKTGGIPEVSSSETRVSDESTIQKSEGDYYLDINAAGYWMVKVLEKR